MFILRWIYPKNKLKRVSNGDMHCYIVFSDGWSRHCSQTRFSRVKSFTPSRPLR